MSAPDAQSRVDDAKREAQSTAPETPEVKLHQITDTEWTFGVGPGGVESRIHYDGHTDRMMAWDQQSAKVNQVIADEAKKWRDAEAAGTLNPDGKMTLAARVPITLWLAFRNEYRKLRAKGYDKTWQTFWCRNLKHSPILREYLATNKPETVIPDVYERDRPVSNFAPLALPHLKPDPLTLAVRKAVKQRDKVTA